MSKLQTVILYGYGGRMGKAIRLIAEEKAIQVMDAKSNDGLQEGEVIIDFSAPDLLDSVLGVAVMLGKPLVCGTTGYTEAQQKRLQKVSEHIPVLYSTNFDYGVNLLFYLTRIASEKLGAGVQAEVIELHHALKKDAPSGTASRLASIIQNSQQDESRKIVCGRQGFRDESRQKEIGVHSLRAGASIHRHQVLFFQEDSCLEIAYGGHGREGFAKGALAAAEWLLKKGPGYYQMEDVLGL